MIAEELAELEALKEMPDEYIVYDEEFSKLTAKEIAEFKRVNPLPEER